MFERNMHYILALLKRFPFLRNAVESLFQIEANIAARWARTSHRRLMRVQWEVQPTPEHFDHRLDLFYQWPSTRNHLWVERGVFGGLALKGGRVLELACGDGFNARHFYSLRSQKVVACDFDPRALSTAKRKNSAPNVEYVLSDVRQGFPQGHFENIIFDMAIEHFTPPEIEKLIMEVKVHLTPGGIFSGCSILEQAHGKSLDHHEYEFTSKDDLKRLFTPHFRNVTVFETVFPGRVNLYFWASDAAIPFSTEWTSQSVQAAPATA